MRTEEIAAQLVDRIVSDVAAGLRDDAIRRLVVVIESLQGGDALPESKSQRKASERDVS